MYVPNGSRLVYHCTISYFLAQPWIVSDLLAKIGGDLHNNNGIEIEASTVDTSFLNKIDITFHLYLQNSVDHNDENDVKSIVDHYFYTNMTSLPISSEIQSIQLPGQAPEDTPAPKPDTSKEPSWWEKLKSDLKIGGAGAVIGVGLGVGLVVILLARETR